MMMVDASAVINLDKGNVLELALQHGMIDANIEGLVYDECKMPECLDAHINNGHLTKLPEQQVDADTFVTLLEKYGLGSGETECIALAIQNNCAIACDDRRARTAATAEVGGDNVTGSLGILKKLVSAGHLSRKQAHDAYVLMRAKGAFLPDVAEDFFEPNA